MLDHTLSTYRRLMASAMAGQVLSDSTVHLNLARLRSAAMEKELRKEDRKEIHRWLKKAIEGDGYVQCRWNEKATRTNRIMPHKGELPFTNVANPDILDSLDSRYDQGRIVCIDYSNHEFRILCGILGIKDAPADLHTHVAEKLGIDRDAAKVLNNAMFYGRDEDFQKRAKILWESEHEWEDKRVEDYLLFVLRVRRLASVYSDSQVEKYRSFGSIINFYGRKVNPKDESTIFNTAIQSVGSEVLIDSIIKLNELSKGKRWHIIFQRFDSIFFDFDKTILKNDLKEVVEVMEGIHDKLNLSVSVSVGRSVGGLREL